MITNIVIIDNIMGLEKVKKLFKDFSKIKINFLIYFQNYYRIFNIYIL